MSDTGRHYIADGYIHGPEDGGHFYVDERLKYIHGPRNSGQFYIAEDGHIYGPGAHGEFYVDARSGYIYGPPDRKLPWRE